MIGDPPGTPDNGRRPRDPVDRARPRPLLRALALTERTRTELVALGSRPRRLVLRGLDSLTPGEHRVAQLAVAGLSNHEIAQNLFITARTVEGHLTHAYQKLAITARERPPRRSAERPGRSSCENSLTRFQRDRGVRPSRWYRRGRVQTGPRSLVGEIPALRSPDTAKCGADRGKYGDGPVPSRPPRPWRRPAVRPRRSGGRMWM